MPVAAQLWRRSWPRWPGRSARVRVRSVGRTLSDEMAVVSWAKKPVDQPPPPPPSTSAGRPTCGAGPEPGVAAPSAGGARVGQGPLLRHVSHDETPMAALREGVFAARGRIARHAENGSQPRSHGSCANTALLDESDRGLAAVMRAAFEARQRVRPKHRVTALVRELGPSSVCHGWAPVERRGARRAACMPRSTPYKLRAAIGNCYPTPFAFRPWEPPCIFRVTRCTSALHRHSGSGPGVATADGPASSNPLSRRASAQRAERGSGSVVDDAEYLTAPWRPGRVAG